MITFPKHAKVGAFVAKENFYDKIDYATKMLFQSEIAKITWEYKLAPETINISAKTWPEMEVFRIETKNYELPLKVFKAIDSNIPYPILFIISKGAVEKAAISYKEQNQKNTNTAKTDTYFETEWNDPKLAQLKIDGLDVDAVYNNFIRQIASDRLTAVQNTNDVDNFENSSAQISDDSAMKDEIERLKEREKIQKQIAILDRKIKSEPSIGKKQSLAEEKYKLSQQLQ